MTKKEKWMAWGLFSIFVFGLLLITGTLFSGVHFVDDHEMMRFVAHMEKNGFWSCVRYEVNRDLGMRFRPLYYFVRICLTTVLGYNYFAWAVFTAGTIVVTLVMSYLCARKLGCNIFYAVLFALVIMVGPQSVVWWKFGPQENIGMAVLMISVWCLLCWAEKEQIHYGIISGILFILLSLYKESFICLLPFAVAVVFLEYWRKREYTFKGFLDGIKKYWLFCVILAFVGVMEVGIILFGVGTNQTGYVGLDTDIGLYEYTVIWMDCFKGPLKWFVLFGLIMIAVMLTRLNRWKEWLNGAVITVVIMVPQVIVYNMTGLSERYILPWSLGYAWFLIITAMRKDGVLYKSKIRQIIMNVCLCGLLAGHFVVFWQEAEHHTYRGVNFQKVWEIVEENTNEDSKILAAFTYFEANMTVTLWGDVNERDHIYTWNEDSKTCVKTTWGGLDSGGESAELEDMEVIMWYSPEHRHYVKEPDIDLSNYDVQQVGTLVIAVHHNNRK